MKKSSALPIILLILVVISGTSWGQSSGSGGTASSGGATTASSGTNNNQNASGTGRFTTRYGRTASSRVNVNRAPNTPSNPNTINEATVVNTPTDAAGTTAATSGLRPGTSIDPNFVTPDIGTPLGTGNIAARNQPIAPLNSTTTVVNPLTGVNGSGSLILPSTTLENDPNGLTFTSDGRVVSDNGVARPVITADGQMVFVQERTTGLGTGQRFPTVTLGQINNLTGEFPFLSGPITLEPNQSAIVNVNGRPITITNNGTVTTTIPGIIVRNGVFTNIVSTGNTTTTNR